MSVPHAHSFQWHPQVHERWAEERLHFWFFKYRSIYDRGKYVQALEERFEELGIHSYTIYELTGGYDLMARIWVPNGIRGIRLRDELESLDKVVIADNFKVQETHRHWPWRDHRNGSYELLTPNAVDMTAGLVSQDLVTLNAVSRQAMVAQRPIATTEPLRGAKRKEALELLKDYEAAKMLVRPKYRRRGIKFIVLVTSQRRDRERVAMITSEIESRLDRASRVNALNEASLYSGEGVDESRHLILARVPHTRYHEVSKRLLEPINKMVAMHATRTVTYNVPTSRFVSHREIFPVSLPSPPDVPDDVEELFERDESQTFEVKGSGLVNLDRWVNQRGKLTESDKVTDSLAKAVVALLNSNGGIVLLGALEEKDFPEDGNGPRRFGAYSDIRIGNYLCVGVDREVRKRRGWDPYVRHLRRKLLEQIGGGSEFWIKPFEKRTITTRDGERRTLVAVPVLEPDEWFWLRGRDFVVRRGPECETLNGPEMTVYMRVTGERGGWRSSKMEEQGNASIGS